MCISGNTQGKVSYEAALSTFMGDLDALVTAKKQNEVRLLAGNMQYRLDHIVAYLLQHYKNIAIRAFASSITSSVFLASKPPNAYTPHTPPIHPHSLCGPHRRPRWLSSPRANPRLSQGPLPLLVYDASTQQADSVVYSSVVHVAFCLSSREETLWNWHMGL